MFVWNQKYATHIEDIDDQHKKLVAILNRIYSDIEDESITEDKLDGLLAELAEYADHHFSEEERLMELKGVVGAHAKLHKMEHQAFIYDLGRLQAKRATAESIPALAQQTTAFVTNWLALHILGIDQSLARQIQAIEAGVSPRAAFDQHKDYTYERAVTGNLVGTLLEMWREAEDKLLELRR